MDDLEKLKIRDLLGSLTPKQLWGITTALCSTMALAFGAGVWWTGEKGPSAKPAVEAAKEEWTGRFLDLNDNTGGLELYDEKLAVRKSENGVFEIETRVLQNGREKAWRYRGFSAGEYLVVAYKNISNETGIGAMILEKSRDVYIGKWIGRTCNAKKVVACPYVLARNGTTNLASYDGQLIARGCEVLDIAALKATPYTAAPCS
jgi:hypothetical protein